MKISGVINNKAQFLRLPKFKAATKAIQNADIKLSGSDVFLNQNKAFFSEIKFKGLENFIRTSKLNKDEIEKREKEVKRINDGYKRTVFNGPSIEKIIRFDDKKYQAFLKLASMSDINGSNLFLPHQIFNILNSADGQYQKIHELTDMKDVNGNFLFDKDAFIELVYLEDDFLYESVIQAIRKSNINSKITAINCDYMQNGDGCFVEIISDAIDVNSGAKIKLFYIVNPNGSISKERAEFYSDGSIFNWRLNGNSSFIEKPEYIKVNGFNDNSFELDDDSKIEIQTLNSQIEIIYDKETKEPISILVTKKSDLLVGVYEKTLYNLADYSEDFDVIEAIKNGSIKGGKRLSYVEKNPDGSISYHENINSNGSTIKRDYTKGVNGVDYSYSFKIIDENGNEILDSSISFTKNSPNQTTTVLNGKIYTAQFDDKTKTIKITTSNKVENIDFNEISQNEDAWATVKKMPINLIKILNNSYWDYTYNEADTFVCNATFLNEISKNKINYFIGFNKSDVVNQTYYEKDNRIDISRDGELIYTMYYNPDWHILKYDGMIIQLDKNITKEQLMQTPLCYVPDFADNKVELDKIAKYVSKIVANGNISYLRAGSNLSLTAHELGHIQDGMSGLLNADPKLIDIYNQEVAQFNSRYTNTSGKNYIKYFSQTGGSSSTGLSELIAETNTMLTTWGHDIPDIIDRAQFLVQNFPKTISYIATKFGMNKVE